MKEKEVSGSPGFPFLLGSIIIVAVMLFGFFRSGDVGSSLISFTFIGLFVFSLKGYLIINPNEVRVLQFFGTYVGTLKSQGLRWVNPFYSAITVSTRIRNFESTKLKVNDLDGNPIEIASIVVWQVVDAAEAIFQIDDFENFIKVQAEAAIRNLAMQYPYDSHSKETLSLHGSPTKVTEELKREVQDRLDKAGVRVIEARLSHLAYAPEIAASMLQRQQANAIIAARQKIVEGAVGMVEMALNRLAQNNVVQLDEERKAAMVSNLLVVLCGERSTQPIINAGSIY